MYIIFNVLCSVCTSFETSTLDVLGGQRIIQIKIRVTKHDLTEIFFQEETRFFVGSSTYSPPMKKSQPFNTITFQQVLLSDVFRDLVF